MSKKKVKKKMYKKKKKDIEIKVEGMIIWKVRDKLKKLWDMKKIIIMMKKIV
jgi:hypothetical protein